MTVVVLVKALSLFFEAMKYHTLKTSGIADGWAVAYFVFAFLRARQPSAFHSLLASRSHLFC
jgi:hypothetical protein